MQHDVIIVGGGPVGMALALDLGLRGRSCAVVEKRTELSLIPKGQGLSQRSFEHLWRWGIADEVRAARALPGEYGIGQVTIYDSVTSDVWDALPARELVQRYYFQANERLPQYRTEQVLRRRVAQLPNVHTYIGWSAVEVGEDDQSAYVVMERSGVRERLTGAYLIGCDGGHSLVRTQAKISCSGTDFGQVMALVVFRSQEFNALLERFPKRTTYRVMSPELDGYWMFFGRVDDDDQFFFHAPVRAGSADDDATEMIFRAAGRPFACEIEHVGLWDLRVEVANEYRAGRIFLAGDASHTHPPYGGFGLNNGLEDAVNLSWKLNAVLEGWGGDALLDTYTPERRDVFRGVGEGIIKGWIEADREFLRHHRSGSEIARFKQEFAEVARGFGKRLRLFEPNYEGSAAVAGPIDGVNSAFGSHELVARAGHHLPPGPLSSGRDVFEQLGPGFTLIALDGDDASVSAFQNSAWEVGVPLAVIRDDRGGGRDQYGSRLILVRPDQFVAWTGDAAPPEPTALLFRLSGRTAAHELSGSAARGI